MSSLFNLALDYRALADLCESIEYDQETGEIFDNTDTLKEFFEGLNADLSYKLDSTMYIIKELEAYEQALRDESDRLKKRAITFENRVKTLRGLMFSALNATGEKSFKTDRFNYSIKRSESVNVANVEELPREYVRLKREADKSKIKEALKNGVVIEGCNIQENFTIGVK